MTSLEQRRHLLQQCHKNLNNLRGSLRSKDSMPLMESMLKFMDTMLEEDEANALVNLLRREGMDR